ncbi:MAG: hypothetical protein ICV64_07195 [Thermoleophilia bacterium]|nr:hypothetical protein [Thermoleophilia bacterium]
MPRLLGVFRGTRPDSAPTPQPRGQRRAAPPVRELRRERRALERLREERIRDLGGLVLEMYRQDSFREHLLDDQCAEVVAIEERLMEVDLLLQARRPPAARCECGAPLFWGARFCSHCGRPVALEGEGTAAS